jgi:vacuolar-type H+-ATPase subunit H
MDDEDILGHLLKIEGEAAALVLDAQAEADRRLAEAEKRNRAAYEQQYQNGLALLESEYKKETDNMREQCQKELAAYREKLNGVNGDTSRFSALLESCFAGEA